MEEPGVRHLPAFRGGKLIDVVSDRNVKGALSTRQAPSLTAADVMRPEPFEVPADTPLDEVAARMAEEKYGSALVKDDDGTFLGIFTTVDACRALRQLLHVHFTK